MDDLEIKNNQLSIINILKFLRNESMKNDIIRAQWNVEKAELHARIAFLQGERRGEDNLKNDLIRRIRMLEYALKMETKRLNELQVIRHKSNNNSINNSSNINCSNVEIENVNDVDDDKQIINQRDKFDLKDIKCMLESSGYRSVMDEIRDNRARQLMRAVNGDSGNRDWDGDHAVYSGSDQKNAEVGNSTENKVTKGEAVEKAAESPIYDTVDDGSGGCPFYTGPRESVNVGLGLQTGSLPPQGSGSDLLDAEFALGELAGLTITNESTSTSAALMDDTLSSSAHNATSSRTTTPAVVPWCAKYTLRSHYDAVRCLCFHDSDSLLATGSEDCTVKLWNLSPSSAAPVSSSSKKNSLANVDLEPIHTFRGHAAPVLSVVIQDDTIYSSDLDGKVKAWYINPQIELYDEYCLGSMRETSLSHSTPVWSMAFQKSGRRLLTGTCVGKLHIWAEESRGVLPQFHELSEIDLSGTIQGAVCTIQVLSDSSEMQNTGDQIIVGSSCGGIVCVDMETGQVIRKFTGGEDYNDDPSLVNKIVQHPRHSSMFISGHSDRTIRIFDLQSGKLTNRLIAHLDAVTGLAFETRCSSNSGEGSMENPCHLISSSHDCSIRIWDLTNQACVQETTAHRKKWDESINDLAVHPALPYFATAGADAVVKVFI